MPGGNLAPRPLPFPSRLTRKALQKLGDFENFLPLCTKLVLILVRCDLFAAWTLNETGALGKETPSVTFIKMKTWQMGEVLPGALETY